MSDCVFCNIANGNIPTDFLYQDDELVAFADIDPKAPQHILIIPREHISTLNDVSDTHAMLLGKMMLTAKSLAVELGIAEPVIAC